MLDGATTVWELFSRPWSHVISRESQKIDGIPNFPNISAPSPPTKLAIKSDQKNIILSWDEPEFPNGIVRNYTVVTFLISLPYGMPEGCKPEELWIENLTPAKNYSHTFEFGFAEYGMKVAALNDGFLGNFSIPKFIKTIPRKPNPPFDFDVLEQTYPDPEENYNVSVTLAWKLPCILHGILDGFHLSFSGKKVGHEDHIFTRTFRPNPDEISPNYSLTEVKFKPDFIYKVNLYIAVKDCDKMSEPAILEFKSLSGSEFCFLLQSFKKINVPI